MKLFGFLEVPAALSNALPIKPPLKGPDDARPVAQVAAAPMLRVYDPNIIQWNNTMLPPMPGDGGYRSAGLGQVAPVAPQWDRGDTALAGPVRQLIGAMMNDRRRVLGF